MDSGTSPSRKHPDAVCEISLTNSDKVALVDAEDYERVMGYRWYLMDYKYVKCTAHIDRRYLHQFILQTKMTIDHKNRNCLDNRKENLRLATTSQNQGNAVGKIFGRAKYKGVYRHSRNNKWIAQITIDYKGKYLGSFDSEEEAARAYDEAARREFGEFARTNF